MNIRLGVVSLMCAVVSPAQLELASLSGIVTDSSGAVLPGASIVATNPATNQSVTGVTNQSGRYFISSLKPATYAVTASLIGFNRYVNRGVTLRVNESGRLDITLSVGEKGDEVVVTAEPPLLDAGTSDRGAVIEPRKMVELPLNGRDYNQLATLSPGVLLSTPRLQSTGFKGAFNVNGNRAFQNAFLLDGVENTSYSNSYRGNNMQVVQPSMDALQEFKIHTNAYSAEFGRSAGALVNAVTKSGTNSLHGSAYEFFRNRELDAANFFANKTGSAKPFRLRNQFGATAGGPAVKDRTFLFGDYEGLRDRAGTVRFSSVPQPQWLQGQFDTPIVNPYDPHDTGADFLRPATPGCNDGKGNCWIIPANLIDPTGWKVAKVSPAPNTGAPGQLENNYVNTPLTRNRTDQFDLRGDEIVSNKLSLFGRYSFSDTNQFMPAPRPGLSEGSVQDTTGTAMWRSQGMAAGAIRVLSPVLISDLRFGYSRGDYFQNPPNFGSACPDQLIGLRNAPTDPAICGGLPIFNIAGSAARRIGRGPSQPQFQTPRNYDWRGSLAWIRSNHALTFGAEVLHLETGIRDIGSLLGQFSMSGRFTGGNNVYPNGIADLLLGFPTRYQQDSNTVFDIWQKVMTFFVQDNWKAGSRLTLNLGVRYELAIPPRERRNQWANFDAARQQFVNARNGGWFDEALVHPDMNDFAPRAAFAFSLFSKTVIRSAYGVFYNHTNRQGREGLLGFNPPFIILADSNIQGSGTLTSADGIFRLQDGIPAGFVDLGRVNLTTVARKAQDPFQRSPYTQQWSFGVQQQLANDVIMDLAYVANKGTKLPAFSNLNQALAGFHPATGAAFAGPRPLAGAGLNGDIQLEQNMANSNFNSLQASLEKRASKGVSLLAAYTWSKTLTDAPDHLSTSAAGNGIDVGVFKEPQNPKNRRAEYGPAEFDVGQRLVFSAVWELRSGSGVLNGWQFSPIFTAQTGLALTVDQPELLNLGGERRSRPNRTGSGALPGSLRTVDRYLDAGAFQILQTDPGKPGFVPFQAFGNSGTGILRAPGLANLDFNVNKTFAITEKSSMQFRAEFFNALNHTNLSVPGVLLGAGFGQITQTATEARIVQFAIKYRF